MIKKTKRLKLRTLDQMRNQLRRRIKDAGVSQARFAHDVLKETPVALSLTLTGKRALSKSMRRLLGVRREIVYRESR